MFGDIFNKLKEAQNLMSHSKNLLESMIIEHKSSCGNLVISLNGNKKILHISVNNHEQMSKEELEKLLITELNDAFAKCETMAQTELKNKAGELFPDISKFL